MIECHFCRAKVADVAAAIDADWIPSFFDGEDEITDPVCPDCQASRLQVADDGELELSPFAHEADLLRVCPQCDGSGWQWPNLGVNCPAGMAVALSACYGPWWVPCPGCNSDGSKPEPDYPRNKLI